MGELLRIRSLTTSNNTESGLNGFRLQIFDHEIAGLIGLNGSGKSLLVDVLSGERQVRKGVLKIGDKRWRLDTQRLSRTLLEENGVYIVKNETRLIKNLNLSENMSISTIKKLRSMLKNPLKQEPLLRALLEEFASDLDISTKGDNLPLSAHWRIGIIKAYMEGAKLIILDRILEYCSAPENEQIMNLVRTFRSKGTAFLVTYNKTARFLKDFDRLAIVRNGRLAAVVHREDYDPESLAGLMTGQAYSETTAVRAGSEIPGKKKLLEIKDLNTENCMAELSLNLFTDEILGVYDPVQENSETLLKVLTGKCEIKSGQILIDGKSVRFESAHHALKYGVGIVSEILFDRLFFEDLSAGDNIMFSAARRASRFLGFISSQVEQYFCKKLPPEIGISAECNDKPVRYVDRHMQFVLALHMKILSGAQILILENPLRSADLITRELVYHNIAAQTKKGLGIIFISSDYSELDGFCDRIIQFEQKGVFQ